MTESGLLLTGLVEELQLYAKTNSPQRRSNLELPLLRSMGNRGPDHGSLADILDAAVVEVSARPEAAALELIFPPSDSVWKTNLSGRQRKAAAEVGLSYDAFRRRRNGEPSHYDALCSRLAQYLVDTHGSTDGYVAGVSDRSDMVAPEGSPTSDPEDQAGTDKGHNRSAPSSAISSAAPTGSQESLVPAKPEPASKQVNRIWKAAALVAIALAVGLAGGLFWSVLSESDSRSDQQDTLAVVGSGCERADAQSERVEDQVRAAIEHELARRGTQPCAVGELRDLGAHFFFDFDEAIHSDGGAAVRVNDDGSYTTAILPPGPWLSYSSVGGSSGRSATDIAGFPTGDVVPSHGGYSIVTDGGGYFHSSTRSGRFSWIPDLAYERWIAEGAEIGALGALLSDLYVYDGSFRVDFENGFLRQLPDGTIQTTLNAASPADLPPPDELRGTIIENTQGYAWFVDNELRRWWLAFDFEYLCAGGDMNRSHADLPNNVIHQLEEAGTASCPLGATGTFPRQGELDIEGYCWTQLPGDAVTTESYDGRSRCVSGDLVQDIELVDVCRWQFGPDAALVAEPDEGPFCNGPTPG